MIISVNGFEEAKSYPVMYNNTEILMDNNRDVFYVKAVDGMGKYSIKTYEFKQIENERPVATADLNNLNAKLDTLIATLQSALAPQVQPVAQLPAQPMQPVQPVKEGLKNVK